MKVDCCDEATEKEIPSHRSQCGGLTVSQSSKAQSRHAHARFLPFSLMQLTINDRGTISISAACSRLRGDENEMMHPFVKAHNGVGQLPIYLRLEWLNLMVSVAPVFGVSRIRVQGRAHGHRSPPFSSESGCCKLWNRVTRILFPCRSRTDRQAAKHRCNPRR